jgi:MFS family permease
MAVFSVPALYFLVKMPPGVDEDLVRKAHAAKRELPSLWSLFLRDRTFRLLGLSIFCVSGVLLALLSQLVSMMTDRGETVSAAATMLSIAGLTSAIGRLFAGWLMDRVHAPYCAAMSFALTLIGVLTLATGATDYTAMVAAALIGVSIGAEADIITFIVSRYFDLRLFGRVCGGMWMAWGWGAGIMIFASGLSFDLTHSYTIALWTFSGFVSIGVVSIMRLGPYVYPEQRDPKRAALGANASA